MLGQFNDTAKITSGGTKLEVTGPVTWDDDELGAKIRARVTQGDVVASGESDYTPSSAETWSATLTTQGGTLQSGGPEPARANATVSKDDGHTEPYPWRDQVELVD
jgi:hypothetical protein